MTRRDGFNLISLSLVLATGAMFIWVGCDTVEPESDNQPPVVTLKGKPVDTIGINHTYVDSGAVATDPEDGDLTSSITVSGTIDTATVGRNTLVYNVQDSEGANASATRIVWVVDNTVRIESPQCPAVYDCTQVTYRIERTLTIPAGCTVTFGPNTKAEVLGKIDVKGELIIAAGAHLSFDNGKYIQVSGTLKVNGTATDSVVMDNLKEGTTWGYGSKADYSGGIWFTAEATRNSVIDYCRIINATSGIYVHDAAVSISHCYIAHNAFNGVFFKGVGSPKDSASFIDNIITGNGEYGIGIDANQLRNLSGTGSVADNTGGGILVTGNNDAVETGVWKKHDASYVVAENIDIQGSPNANTITIEPGAVFEFLAGKYLSVGESHSGTLIAHGTPGDSIVFTNHTEGTNWGYGENSNYAGGIWIGAKATTNTSLTYCSITRATNGMYVHDVAVEISHCSISSNACTGIRCKGIGGPKDSASFVDNTITGNGEYAMMIDANMAGNLSGTGSVAGNGKGGIVLEGNNKVTTDAVWRKHDAPYIVADKIGVGASGGATLTLRPGVALHFNKDTHLGVGESQTGTLIANGTAQDSIIFSSATSGTKWGYGSSANYSGGIWLATNTSSNTSVTYAVISQAVTGVYLADVPVTIQNCTIENSQYYPVCAHHNADLSGVTNNTYAGNGSGDEEFVN